MKMGLCFSSGNMSKVSPVPGAFKTNYEILQTLQLLNLKRYQFSELQQATTDFTPNNLNGFKGWINGKLVFLELIDPTDFQGKHKLLEKMKHVQELCHPNILKLNGFCLKDDKWFLVKEFVCGSLKEYLRGIGGEFPPKTWSVSMKIVVGIAKGLAYLHHDAHLILQDFKPSEVYLDSKCNVKLSDFEAIKERPTMGCHVNYLHARLFGTPGYVAPEYISTGVLSAKCNVFSFGMIVLEILTGKAAIRIERPAGNENSEEWARNLLVKAERDSYVLLNEMVLEEKSNVSKVAELAFECVSVDPKLRPDMNHVVQILEQLQLC